MPHKRFQTCHAQGVIDADLSRSRRGVAEKGHFWTETSKRGGEGGIRTHDPVFDRIPLFESGAFSRSATSPASFPDPTRLT